MNSNYNNLYVGKVKLKDRIYIYEVEYKKIKNMYMKINDEKILISANKKIPINEIEKFILQKEKWILNVIEKQKNREEIKKEKRYTEKEFEEIILENVKYYSSLMKVFPNKISLKKTRPEHLNGNDDSELISVQQDNSTSMMSDGNNVDMDLEKVNQAANSLMYNALITQANSKLSMTKNVINGGN